MLQNKYVNITSDDLINSINPLGGQSISGSSKYVEEYEEEVKNLFGKEYTVAVNSGTVAIYCALKAIGVGAGDEVILPATAVIMSGIPALMLGAKVRFADITEKPGFGLDHSSVKKLINSNTKAVISVPLWGYPVPMQELTELCNESNIVLIEDVSQSHGTTWKGKLLGTYGSLGCFSTHERKLITTGEGGFILTDDSKLAHNMRVFRRYGIDQVEHSIKLGMNFKLNGLSAALGITQVKKLYQKISLREAVAIAIKKGISGLSWLEEINVEDHSQQNYYALVFRIIDTNIDVKKLEDHLYTNGIISDTWRYKFKPLYKYPVFKNESDICERAEALIPKVITLPCHEGMTQNDISTVINAMNNFIK